MSSNGSPAEFGIGVGVRHDKSLLPTLSIDTGKHTQAQASGHDKPAKDSHNAHARAITISTSPPPTHGVENTASTSKSKSDISNPDHRKQFIPGHRSGMSSMEHIETKLFSALGEELNSFSQTLIGTGTTSNLNSDSGPAVCFEDPESPLVKRKRQGSFGGQRGKSPNMKIARALEENKENIGGMHVPQMRGGD